MKICIKINLFGEGTEIREFETISLMGRMSKVVDLYDLDMRDRRWRPDCLLAEGTQAFFFAPGDGYQYLLTEEEFRYLMEQEKTSKYQGCREHANNVLAALDGIYTGKDWLKDHFLTGAGCRGTLSAKTVKDGKEWTIFAM